MSRRTGSQMDCIDNINVPETPLVDFSNEPVKAIEDKIVAANAEASLRMANAKADALLRIVHIYSQSEDKRIESQKPLREAVTSLVKWQLAIFNFIILGVVIVSLYLGGADVISGLFDFLKYYLGATLVELLGMLYFITKKTFSPNSIEQILKNLDLKQDHDKK